MPRPRAWGYPLAAKRAREEGGERDAVDAAAQNRKTGTMFDPSRPLPLGVDRRNWPWFAGGFVVVVGLLLLVDVPLSQGARAWPYPWASFFAQITDIGTAYWLLLPTSKLMLLVGGLWAISRSDLARQALTELFQILGFVFAGVALPSLIGNLIKRAIGRGRPELFDEAGHLGFQNFVNDHTYQSFPSGHATTAFAMAMVVGFLAPRYLFVLALVVAALVAVSRVAVGLHYPSDVLAGAVAGVLLTYAVRWLFALKRWVFVQLTDGRIVRKPLAATAALWRSFQRR